VVYPAYRRLKARKARSATRHLTARMDAWRRGDITFAELDAAVKGWINHVRYADSWGLRKHVFNKLSQR
jgi:RNA-directed DNA polymerase